MVPVKPYINRKEKEIDVCWTKTHINNYATEPLPTKIDIMKRGRLSNYEDGFDIFVQDVNEAPIVARDT